MSFNVIIDVLQIHSCYVEKLSQETKEFNEKPHVTTRYQAPGTLVHAGM